MNTFNLLINEILSYNMKKKNKYVWKATIKITMPDEVGMRNKLILIK